MSDPFSTSVRKYIPWPEHKKLTAALSAGSLIDQIHPTQNEIEKRLEELNEYELRFGFVYLSEKKWLESRTLEDGEIPYSNWVATQLMEVVFPNGLVYREVEASGDLLGSDESWREEANCDSWEGYTEDLSVFTLFSDLIESSVPVTDVHLYIPGNSSGPDPSKLCHAFEILHNISYYLQIAATRYNEGWHFHYIALEKEEGHWELGLISEYGAGLDLAFSYTQLKG